MSAPNASSFDAHDAHSVTRVTLVRHGRTAWNAQARIQGQIDIPLNAVGHAQAAAGLPVFPFPKEREYFVEMKLRA